MKEVKYKNPRIEYDGVNWYITTEIEYEDLISTPTEESIGINLGMKNSAVYSNKDKYQNINKTQKNKETRKRKRGLRRSISRDMKNICTK